MSLKTPTYNPPYPYPQRGMYRVVRRPTIKGRRKGTKKKGVKGMFARERGMEQAFKFGQIRSGLEGIATFRGQTERKPSREQVASDFMTIHAKSLKNQERDKEDKEFMKSHPKLEDWSERTAGAIQEKKEEKAVALRLEDRKQSAFERNATDQLQLQRDALHQQGRISYDAKADRARMMDTLETELRNHNDRWRDTEYRTGARDSKIFSVIEGLSQRLSGEGAQVGGIQSLPSSVARRPSVAFSTSSDEPQIEEIEEADEPLLRQVSGGGSPRRNYADFSSADEDTRKDLQRLSSQQRELRGQQRASEIRQREATGEKVSVGAPLGLSDVGGFLQTEEAQPKTLMSVLGRAFSPRKSPAERELTQAQSDNLLEASAKRRDIELKIAQLDDDERLLRQSSNLAPAKSTGLQRQPSAGEQLGLRLWQTSPRGRGTPRAGWGGSEASLSRIKAEAEREEREKEERARGGFAPQGFGDLPPMSEAEKREAQEGRERVFSALSETLTPRKPPPLPEPSPEPELQPSPQETLAQQKQESFEASMRASGSTPTLKAQSPRPALPPALQLGGGAVEEVERSQVADEPEPEPQPRRSLSPDWFAQQMEKEAGRAGRGVSQEVSEERKLREDLRAQHEEEMKKIGGGTGMRQRKPQPPPPSSAVRSRGRGVVEDVEEVEEEQPAPKSIINPLERYSRGLTDEKHRLVGAKREGHPLRTDTPSFSLQATQDGLFKRGSFKPKKGEIMDVVIINHKNNKYTTRLRSKSDRDADGNVVPEGLGGWGNYTQASIHKLIDEGKLRLV